MIVSLRHLRANRRYVGVIAEAGPEGGRERFVITINGEVVHVEEQFAPGEVRAIVAEHHQPGARMATVTVRTPDREITGVLNLTGDDDWPYPGTEQSSSS